MWTPYEYVINNEMRSRGSRKGKYTWSLPSFSSTTSLCSPDQGSKSGGGSVQIVGTPSDCGTGRSIKFEASFKGTYHSSATDMAQIGFNQWQFPPYEWGINLQDIGFIPRGKEWVKYNSDNGIPQAAFSYVIDFKIPCESGSNSSLVNKFVPPGIRLSFTRKDFGLAEDCTVFLQAQESYKIFWDPTISPSFNAVWAGLLASGDFTSSRDAVITYLGDVNLSGIQTILGPANSMLSGLVTTSLDAIYPASDIYGNFVAINGTQPLNGGLMIGE